MEFPPLDALSHRVRDELERAGVTRRVRLVPSDALTVEREWSRRGSERGSVTRSNVATGKAMEFPRSMLCPIGFGVSLDEEAGREECASCPRRLRSRSRRCGTKSGERPTEEFANIALDFFVGD